MEKYNVKKAAKFLNVSQQTVRNYCRAGLLNFERKKTGMRVGFMFLKSDLIKFKEEYL